MADALCCYLSRASHQRTNGGISCNEKWLQLFKQVAYSNMEPSNRSITDKKMDINLLEKQLGQVMQAIGLNIENNPERAATPRRVLKYWLEQLSNEHEKFKWTVFSSKTDEMVIVKDIHFASSCEHHLLPFFGTAHVAYIPQGKIVGISKLPRAVEYYSKGFQTQEHLTQKIAANILSKLECESVAVVMEAEHTCMSCRGVRAHGSTTQTSALFGAFKDDKATRQEFYNLIT